MIESQVQPLMNEGTQFEVGGGADIENVGVEIHDRRAVDVSVHVVNDGLQIVESLLRLPQPLVDAGFVLQGGDDDPAIDGLATAGCILQDLLGLLQID